LQGLLRFPGSSSFFGSPALIAAPTVTAGSIACPLDGGKEVENLSLKRLTHFILLPGREGEWLWGRCLGGEEDDEPPGQLTVVNPSGSVTELIAVAVSLAADMTESSLAKSLRASFFFQTSNLVESLEQEASSSSFLHANSCQQHKRDVLFPEQSHLGIHYGACTCGDAKERERVSLVFLDSCCKFQDSHSDCQISWSELQRFWGWRKCGDSCKRGR
jgi:hypothetical protein